MTSAAPVLSVRVSASERALLEAAAAQAHTSLSDFVRRRAIEAAELDVLGRSIVTVPPEAWDRIEAWLGAPAKDVPGLRELAERKPAWQD
jgi:uncharacterized protein (DUF1778 family)